MRRHRETPPARHRAQIFLLPEIADRAIGWKAEFGPVHFELLLAAIAYIEYGQIFRLQPRHFGNPCYLMPRVKNSLLALAF